MREIREDHDGSPEGHEGDRPKVVDVRESIRYRRRAQEAESRLVSLESELASARESADERVAALEAALEDERRSRSDMERRLATNERDRLLERELSRAGAVDTETALLVARERLAELPEGAEVDVKDLARRVLEEKPHLRVETREDVPPLGRVSQAVRPQREGEQATARRLADAARRTGRRPDVAAYMRARRGTRR